MYRVGLKRPSKIDTALIFEKEYVTELNEVKYTYRVLDDTSVEGATLGLRRLNLAAQGVRLYPLSTSVYFISDLIKLATSNKVWFIDSSGRIFTYTKTTLVPIVITKITKVVPSSSVGCILEVKNIQGRFKSLVYPTERDTHAAFIKLGPQSYLLFGLCDETAKAYRRKI